MYNIKMSLKSTSLKNQIATYKIGSTFPQNVWHYNHSKYPSTQTHIRHHSDTVTLAPCTSHGDHMSRGSSLRPTGSGPPSLGPLSHLGCECYGCSQCSQRERIMMLLKVLYLGEQQVKSIL